MCDATVIAGAGLLTEVGGQLLGASAQNDRARTVAGLAKANLRLNYRDLGIRQQEETSAASINIEQIARQVAGAQGSTVAAAASGGVTGNSVTALKADLQRQGLESKMTVLRNRDSTVNQLQRGKLSAAAEAAATIAGAPPANPAATLLGVAGAGLSFGNTLINRRPVLSTNTSGYRLQQRGNTTPSGGR